MCTWVGVTNTWGKCSTTWPMGWGAALILWSMESISIRTYILLNLLWFVGTHRCTHSCSCLHQLKRSRDTAEPSELSLMQTMERMPVQCSLGGGPWSWHHLCHTEGSADPKESWQIKSGGYSFPLTMSEQVQQLFKICSTYTDFVFPLTSFWTLG